MLDLETRQMLSQALDKHVERHADGHAARAARRSYPGYAGADVDTLVEQGWLSMALPADAGGMRLGLSGPALIAEGLARTYSADPFLGLYLGARSYALSGATADLDGLTEGSRKLALAWSEIPTQWSDITPKTSFADGKLDGRKTHVVAARQADGILVTARDGDNWVLALVDADTLDADGAFRPDGSPIDSLSLASRAAEVIAQGDSVQPAIRRALDETSVLVAAELMGHVDAMMVLVLEHLNTRQQFGRAIGSFQALQHRAADMFVRQRLARAVMDAALLRLDQTDDMRVFGQQAARVRARLNDTTQYVMREAIQLFGAMGITDENELSLHVKRCMSLLGWLGNSTAQRRYFMDLS